jgi:hypothetical protein
MGTVVTVIIILIVGLLALGYVTSFKARVSGFYEINLTPSESASLVEKAFPRLLWKPVEGSGAMNFQRRLIKHPGPVVSVDIERASSGGSSIRVWMSEWATMYGMIVGAEHVCLQLIKVRRRLARTGLIPIG